MDFNTNQPCRRELGNGLVLRALETEDDAVRLSDFNAEVHGDEEGIRELTYRLIHDHPASQARYWLFVERTDTGQILSSVALIPWVLSYEGIEVPAAEMGIVGTREDSRGQGLIRQLVARFDELVGQDGYLLSHIQGIPYFYRQFGYEYAVPLEEHVVVELRSVPDSAAVEGSDAHSARPAEPTDAQTIRRCSEAQTEGWGLRSVRREAEWDFILGPSLETCCAADAYVVRRRNEAVGFFRVARQGFGDGLILQECSELPRPALAVVFRFLKHLAVERGKPYIRLNLPRFCAAVRFAADLGGRRTGGYRWQVRLPDLPAFLRSILPVLSARIGTGEFENHSGELTISMYRSALVLSIADGQVQAVTPAAAGERADVRFPPNLCAPLMLGDRTLAECRDFYADVAADPRSERLFSALFPRMRGYLFPPY